MKKKDRIKEIARKYGVNPRTVSRWAARRAPISDVKQLSQWLAASRQPPRAGPAKSKAPVADKIAGAPAIPQQIGAAAALTRLERQELQDWTDLQTAMQSGDEISIRVCRDKWLKTSEGLRRYDLAVESARRSSGELVSRQEMVKLCHALNDALYEAGFCFADVCPRLAGLPDAAAVWKILLRLRAEWTHSICAALKRPRKNPVPGWMIDALIEGREPLSKGRADQAAKYWFAVSRIMNEVASRERAAFEKFKAMA